MTAGVQCDNCRTFGPQRPPGWFVLGQQPRDDDERPSVLAALFGNPSEPLTFCTIECLRDWAYVHAETDGAAAGSELG